MTNAPECNQVDKIDPSRRFPASLPLPDYLPYTLKSGAEGHITGFRMGDIAYLPQLAGSTQWLNAGRTNLPFSLLSPAQVGFHPSGDVLVATVNDSTEIHVFTVGLDSLASTQQVAMGAASACRTPMTCLRRPGYNRERPCPL